MVRGSAGGGGSPLKLPENCMILKKIHLGGKGGPGPQGPLDPHGSKILVRGAADFLPKREP